MDAWEKFNETSLPETEEFFSHLNMKDIIDADYFHVKKVCKDFEMKHLGKHPDLYVTRIDKNREEFTKNISCILHTVY